MITDYNNTGSQTLFIPNIAKTKSYIPTPSCILEHILTTTNLTSCEKLYYLLADSLSIISKNKNHHRSCALPSEDWAERLGCSRSLVFTMQQSLVKKGYFIINKDFDKIGRNKRNLIIPTLPTSVFNRLNEKYPDRAGDHTPYNPLSECKRSYLDRTKLFIKLNYDLLKIITSNEYLNPRQKILWLNFYTRCYKNYMLTTREDFNLGKYSYDDSSFSFISSYRELAELYSCNTKHLSKSIRALERLGFIKAQNIYIRKRCGGNDDCKIQERQDQSLWKITLSLPDECILELEKVKDRSNLKLKDVTEGVVGINKSVSKNIDPKLIEDCLILGGIKFNLSLEQSALLKSAIVDHGDDMHIDNGDDQDSSDYSGVVNCNSSIDAVSAQQHSGLHESYIDSVMTELNVEEFGELGNLSYQAKESSKLEDIDLSSNTAKTLSTSSSIEALDDKKEKSTGIKSDPHVAKSGLLLNKDFLLKIKEYKSNLSNKPKVLFNGFLKRFRQDNSTLNIDNQKKKQEFNIHSELIREKLKQLPKDKADKARKFAYSLISKGLASGYAATISKHDLAKQIIHHAATWKPTKLGSISREKEIDTALSVAWKKIIGGTWKIPLELAKAEILQYEFKYYRQKYQESGILSHEAKALESDVNNLLGGWCDLVGKITKGINTPAKLEEDTFSITDANSSVSGNSPLELEVEKREYQQSLYLSEDIELDSSFVFDLASTQGNHHFDYNFTENKERSNCINVNLSHIPDQQKHLKVIPSDNDDSMKLQTINGKEYFVKLKELAMNESGEFVMTLSPSSNPFQQVSVFKDYDDLLLSSNNTLSLDNTKDVVI